MQDNRGMIDVERGRFLCLLAMALALSLGLSACGTEPVPPSLLDSEFLPLTKAQLDDITSPRFAGTLAAVGSTVPERAALLTDLQTRLAKLQHARREPSSPGAIDDNPETLAANASRLARGDLLTIRLLLVGLQVPGVRTQIMQLIREDIADKTSEHGGAITLAPGGTGLQFAVIPPMFGGRDTEYITPDEALRLAAGGLALFHLHAHQVDDADLAGPGVGDLRFAREMQANCVVITSLSPTSFDVDYYTPNGAVVDLGVYSSKD